MYHSAPSQEIKVLFGLLLSAAILYRTTYTQDYLSECDQNDALPTCSSDKFLTCLSRKCQCNDVVDQIYDFTLHTCVVMVGRKCLDESNLQMSTRFSVDLDPRQLNAEPIRSLPFSSIFPKCSNNAFCDLSSLTCKCKKGYFFNETSGICELSLGKQCQLENKVVQSQSGNKEKVHPSSPLLTLQVPYLSSTTYLGCDTSVGLHCGLDGICKCNDDSIWQISRGCVSFTTAGGNNNMEKISKDKNLTSTDVDSGIGKTLVSNNDSIPSVISFYDNNNGEYEGLAPFQNLVNTYTKLLIDLQNYDYLNNNNDNQQTGIMGTLDNNGLLDVQDKIVFSPDPVQLNSNRNQFPGGEQHQGQHSPIWNQLLQHNTQMQQQQHTSTVSSVSNNDTVNLEDLIKLQQQAAQLQKLLIQQQQLQKLIEQLSTTENYLQNQYQQSPGLPNPPAIVPPQNNYLGTGNQNFGTTPSHRYPPYHHSQSPHQQQQQQWTNKPQQGPYQNQQSNFGWPFPLFRFWKNMLVEPFRRTLFPNLSDALQSFPSPLHIAANTVNNVLPVLRTIDHQFTPVLHRVIELTKPRPRVSTLPASIKDVARKALYYQPSTGNAFHLPHAMELWKKSSLIETQNCL